MPRIPPPRSTSKSINEPHDPLSEVANEGMKLMERLMRERGLPTDSIVVMIDSGKLGTTAMHRDDGEADGGSLLATLLVHARAVARSEGSDLDLAFLGRG